MTIYTENHSFGYEAENIVNLFFPNEKNIIVPIKNSPPPAEDCMLTFRRRSIQGELVGAELCVGDFRKSRSIVLDPNAADYEHEAERQMAVCMYCLLAEYTGHEQPWGILTGVRPIKLLRRLKNAEGITAAVAYFREKLFVSEEKIKLAVTVEENEQKILALSRSDSFSLYVSIPFCPSRCSYCSFVSQSIEKAEKLIEPYVNLLCEEIKHTAQIARACHLRLETVYIGGGTPTTLNPAQLGLLIGTIQSSFDLSACREFTVEAGRPDTIDAAKLNVIHERGIDRISINPQTLNNSVLQTIGRRHTAEQVLEAYELAAKIGFKNINMDLIAGLPSDTYPSFANTLDGVCALAPSNITVHSLAKKRSSGMSIQGAAVNTESGAVDMLNLCERKLTANGYRPYYLYRQSRMVGNLENVGWAKTGFDGLYNVYVMDETHTILGCGAGAVTKLKNPYNETLTRIFNYKYPYEYINGFEEMLKRKAQVKTFYDELS